MLEISSYTATARKETSWSTAVTRGILDATPQTFPNLFPGTDPGRPTCVVIDENVHRQYGGKIEQLLSRYRIRYGQLLVVPGGENSKKNGSVATIVRGMRNLAVERFGTGIIGFGGGVIHDLTQFAASQYRRGVDGIFVGTTLTAMVDAMFALKNGVSEGYKNGAGSYHPAVRSYGDLDFLGTVPPEELLNGSGEILKAAIICPDSGLFELMEDVEGREAGSLVRSSYSCEGADEIVGRTAVTMLRDQLEPNPYEGDPARPSYLGHALSPTWEPTIPHGLAVAQEILLVCLIVEQRALLSSELRRRIVRLSRSLGFPLWDERLDTIEDLSAGLADTARHRGGRMLVTAPVGLGEVVYLNDITRIEVDAAAAALRAGLGED